MQDVEGQNDVVRLVRGGQRFGVGKLEPELRASLPGALLAGDGKGCGCIAGRGMNLIWVDETGMLGRRPSPDIWKRRRWLMHPRMGLDQQQPGQ
jgi:hypothetical protein